MSEDLEQIARQAADQARAAHRGEVLPSAQESHELEQAALKDEDSIVDLARANTLQAMRIEKQLIGEMETWRDKPQALRAVADARAKSVDTWMKITGRDAPRAADDFTGMLQGLAAKGLLKVHVELGKPE